jgi:hypothetical protein
VMFDENSIRGGERVGYFGTDAAVQASALPKILSCESAFGRSKH